MNITATVHLEDKVTVRVNDSNPSAPFAMIQIAEHSIYFEGYGIQNAHTLRILASQATAAANFMEKLVKENPKGEGSVSVER